MCGVALTVLSAVSTAIGTFATFKQASAEKKAANQRARAAAEEARDIRLAGIEAAEDRREEAVQLFSEQRAAFAANGGVFDGSNARVAYDDYEEGVQDALDERENAERRAESRERSGQLAQDEANSINPLFEAGTTLAGGIYDTAGTFDWMRADTSSTFTPTTYEVG